jgi:hypothetical protein
VKHFKETKGGRKVMCKAVEEYGDIIHQNAYTGAESQKWWLLDMGNGQYMFISAANGKVLDVQNAATNNGANVQIYEGNGTLAQQWSLIQK